MKISDKGLELIKSFEGCHLTAYKCPAGVWTIGYGHTKGVYEGMTITAAKADSFLREDCGKAEKNVSSFDAKYAWTQNEFDALVSFAYNVGSINQLTAKGTRSKDVIAKKMLEYNKGGGKVLAGLVRRRKAEQALFLSAQSNPTKTVIKTSTVLKKDSKGDDVRKLQEDLTIRGYGLGKIDGVFGNATRKAVVAFQKDAGLTQDGKVGTNTKKALNNIKVYSKKNDGTESVSNNFKVKEFACSDGDTIVVDVEFVKTTLQKIRNHFNAPITINSAYRTPAHNKKVGGASNSYHMKGRAFDIVVKGHTPSELAKYARSIGVKGVIEYNTFVHVDSRPNKYWARNNNGKVTSFK
jgi:GH24 family phage-related lysozyme (muramidase)